eukprot:scaffold28108_cov61-Phaeocystis_antarctica.AAC.3
MVPFCIPGQAHFVARRRSVCLLALQLPGASGRVAGRERAMEVGKVQQRAWVSSALGGGVADMNCEMVEDTGTT